MNSKAKKLSALSLAILSLGSGMGSVLDKNLDLAPKASAFSLSKSSIDNIPKFEDAFNDKEFKDGVDIVIKDLNEAIKKSKSSDDDDQYTKELRFEDLKNTFDDISKKNISGSYYYDYSDRSQKSQEKSLLVFSAKYKIAILYSKYVLKCNNISITQVDDPSYGSLFKMIEFTDNVNNALGDDFSKSLVSKFMKDLSMYSQLDYFKLINGLSKNGNIIVFSMVLIGLSMCSSTSRAFIKDGIGFIDYQFKKICNRYIYNRFQLNQNPVELKRIIDKCLKEKILCQNEAIDRISDIISGMADKWNESDKTKIPCTSACTMTFMGDSGVGKTYAARALSKALYHKDMQPWQFITSTSVTSSNVTTNNSSNLSPADQIFNEKSELIRQLKLNNKVIVVLDEIDKMHKIDTDDTILERLRDARDTGKLLVRSGVDYDYVDVSRTVFICITNEARECWGLPKEDLGEVKSASRTHIQRDKSLVNRFDVVEFKYFTVEDYMSMLAPMVNSLKEYVKSYNLDLDADENLVRKISEAAEARNKGARGLNDYLVHLRGKLVGYRDINEKSLKNSVHKVHATYNEDTDDFEVKKCD